MKNLTFITFGVGVGGAQKNIVFVANQAVDAGYKVSILVVANRKKGLFIDKHIKVVELNYMFPVFIGNKIKKLIKALSMAFSIRKAIKKEKPDVVIIFVYDLIRIAFFALLGLKVKKVACERDNPYDFSIKQLKRADWFYSRFDQVMFQLPRAKEIFSKTIKDKAIIIPNPCIPRINKIPPYKGVRKKVFVLAARLEKIKNIDLAIHAFAIVHKKHSDYLLHIYGLGPQFPILTKLIRLYGLEKVVIMKGLVNDVFLQERDCSALVLSSKAEGIPNVLIEAMAIGIPCISTDTEPGGPRLLFKDNKGLLVPVGDVNKMVKAISYYIENPKIANEIGKTGIAVIELFNPSRIGEKWILAIDKVLNEE